MLKKRAYVRYSLDFAKNVQNLFWKSYPRATYLIAEYYGITAEMCRKIAQIRGEKFYLYKKAVKRLDKYMIYCPGSDQPSKEWCNRVLRGTYLERFFDYMD